MYIKASDLVLQSPLNTFFLYLYTTLFYSLNWYIRDLWYQHLKRAFQFKLTIWIWWIFEFVYQRSLKPTFKTIFTVEINHLNLMNIQLACQKSLIPTFKTNVLGQINHLNLCMRVINSQFLFSAVKTHV